MVDSMDFAGTDDWNGLIFNPPDWYVDGLRLSEPAPTQRVSFPQLPLFDYKPNPPMCVRGKALVTIDGFDVKHLKRNIKIRLVDAEADVEVPELGPSSSSSTAPVTSAAISQTRWDMDFSSFFLPELGRQRIEVGFWLKDPLLSFLFDGHFPVTAKDTGSQLMLVNPRYFRAGRGALVDLRFDPGVPETKGIASFNIALRVTDNQNGIYSLPILVDPRMGNEG